MDRFYIGPYDAESGLTTDLKPFMIPDSAFSTLNNAYIFRGRIKKRFGTRWFGQTQQQSRLRMSVKNNMEVVITTDGSGSANGIVAGASGAVGQQFTIGTTIFTVSVLGSPGTLLVSNGSATTATFDTSTGAFIFVGVKDSGGNIVMNQTVFWYPALPVMGLETYQNSSINAEQLIAFDTKYAYIYTTGWDRLDGEAIGNGGASVWKGSNSQFFWTTTYTGASIGANTDPSVFVFYVTNFNQNESNFMRTLYPDPAPNGPLKWHNFSPTINAAPQSTNTIILISALILVAFKNRLLAFNVWENVNGTATNYSNRMRYSAIGSPLTANAWRTDIPGNGGGVDCPTLQAIVTVEFVKDRLIVFMEQSTWEIVYTNNQAEPFVWQQINTEFGAESTFSIVPFDKVAIGVGNIGIIACTGANVERIDNKIPDAVFDIHIADSGVNRVYGIRDYYTEMLYWTYPADDDNASFPYPNRVLVYNYKNGTWAFNDDSFTVFGYYQPVTGQNLVTWDDPVITWDDEVSWDSGELEAQFRNVVAGNQEGWTFIVDREYPLNAPSLQISNMVVNANNNITITAIDHNMRVGPTEYLFFQGIAGSGNLTTINGTISAVATVVDPNTFTINFQGPLISGNYSGGGLLARVSNIQILTKQYNFYKQHGRNFFISKVDFLVDSDGNQTNEDPTQISDGQIQVNYYVSTAPNNMVTDAIGTGTLLGTSVLETFAYPDVPFEQYATQLWHPVYIQADGEFIQLYLNFTDDMMRNVLVRDAIFELHSMIFHTAQSAYRLQ